MAIFRECCDICFRNRERIIKLISCKDRGRYFIFFHLKIQRGANFCIHFCVVLLSMQDDSRTVSSAIFVLRQLLILHIHLKHGAFTEEKRIKVRNNVGKLRWVNYKWQKHPLVRRNKCPKQMFNIKVLNTKLPDSNTRLINAMNWIKCKRKPSQGCNSQDAEPSFCQKKHKRININVQ